VKIGNVSAQTGLTKRTIRFYIQEGLIDPAVVVRNGREYREYSEKDLETLRTVALLRRARFSIDQIRVMQLSPERIPAVLGEYCRALREESVRLSELLAVATAIDPGRLTDVRSLSGAFEKAAAHRPLPAADRSPRFGRLDGPEFSESPETKQWHDRQYQHRKISMPPPAYIPVTNSRGPTAGISPAAAALGEHWNDELPQWTGTVYAGVAGAVVMVWIVVMAIALRKDSISVHTGLWICIAATVLAGLLCLLLALRRRRRRRRSRRKTGS